MPKYGRFSIALMTRSLGVLAVVVIAFATTTTSGHSGHRPARPIKPTANELAAFRSAKPVFEQYCFGCHVTTSKKAKRKALDHMGMDSYPFTGHHAGEAGSAIRTVLGADGSSKATMPSDAPGIVMGADLAKLLAWADAFDEAHGIKNPAAAPTTKENTHVH